MLDWCVDCSRGVKHIGAVPVGCGGCGRTSHLHISHYLSISHAFSSDAIQRHHHQSLLSPSFKIQFQSKIRTTNIHAEKWHWWTRGFRKEHLLPTSNYDDDSIKKERKLHNYRSQVSLGSGLWVPVSLTPYLHTSKSFGWDFADVTLADDDTNSILADDTNFGLSFR